MALWIPITILAAFAQNLRFMLQKHLKDTSLSSGGATLSRFLFSFPLAGALVWTYASLSDQALPETSARFWAFALAGAVSQIIATMCVVSIFQHRNFAIGITFKKTEVIQTAIIGFVLLGEGLHPLALVAIFIGLGGVLVLSDPPAATGRWRDRIWNRAAGLGLLSGLLFGMSSIGYRGASLSLEQPDPFLAAMMTLALVTFTQTVLLSAWLLWREAGQFTKVLKSWRVSRWVGLTSMIGSLGWFTAFTLQNAAYVKALGQIELVFAFLASQFFFGEKTSRREVMGVCLIVLSILVLIASL